MTLRTRFIALFACLIGGSTLVAQSPPRNLRGIESVALRVTVLEHEDPLDSVAIRKAIEAELRTAGISIARPPLDSIRGAYVRVDIGASPLPAQDGTRLGDFYDLLITVARPARLYGAGASGDFVVWSGQLRSGYVPIGSHIDRFVRDEAAAGTRGLVYDYRAGNSP